MRSPELLHRALDEIILSRKALQAGLKDLETRYPEQMHVYDSYTNFVLVRMPRAKEIFEGLLSKGIAVRFMGDTLRITAGSEEENAQLLKNLESLVSSSTNP